jgi:hypothetical protein
MKTNKLSIGNISVFALLFLFLLTGSCQTEKKAVTTVTPIDSASQYTTENLIYGLPRTHLYFDIQLVRKTIVPGPYHKYCEKLLGISSVPHKKNKVWSISDIKMQESLDIDYQQLFAINPAGDFSILQHNLTKKGWIIPMTNKLKPLPDQDFISQKEHPEGITYKDLSVRKFVGKETRTEYKNVWKDSLYAKVPVETTKMIKKSESEKAQEAASFIFMIREKRFELLSGMADFFPDGEALKTSVSELNQLEDNYLSLFTGKVFKDTINYTLFMNPELRDTRKANMLFRFSEKKGIIEPDVNEGVPVWVEYEMIENTTPLEDYFGKSIDTEKPDDFYYRFPRRSEVKLMYGDDLIAKRFLDIFQFGPLVKIPHKYLNEQAIIRYHKDEE